MGHPNFNDLQTYEVQYKASQSAKCHGFGCETISQIGVTCVKVDGGISIPYTKDYARKEIIYFCPSLDCIHKPPVWTNLRYPDQFVCSVPGLDDVKNGLNDKLITRTMV